LSKASHSQEGRNDTRQKKTKKSGVRVKEGYCRTTQPHPPPKRETIKTWQSQRTAKAHKNTNEETSIPIRAEKNARKKPCYILKGGPLKGELNYGEEDGKSFRPSVKKNNPLSPNTGKVTVPKKKKKSDIN